MRFPRISKASSQALRQAALFSVRMFCIKFLFIMSGLINSSYCCSSCSTVLATFVSVRTALSGYWPTADSLESMIASVWSKMAFAASEISARVATGLSTIDCRTWVAVMTGLP